MGVFFGSARPAKTSSMTPMENPLSERAGQKQGNEGAKKNDRYDHYPKDEKKRPQQPEKKFLRVVIEVEAALWLLIAVALLIKTLR